MFFNRNLWQKTKTASLSAVLLAVMISACSNAETNKSASTSKETNSTKAPASSTSNNAELTKILTENLSKSGINAKIISASETKMPNIYWVKAEGLPAFFTDKSGEYIIQGEIVKIGGNQPEHISANLIAEDAKAVLAGIDKKDMIIFPATGATKGVVYAFTDADCGYCRKLHSEIKQINSLGIEVRYLAWPRSPQFMPIMEKIWCSKDRNTAMTEAKLGKSIQAPACENPVAKLHAIGESLGINGTPAIFTEDGHQIGGYLPPQALAQALNIK